MSWGRIILIMVLVGLGVGVLMGGLAALFGLSRGVATSGVGVAMGVTAGLLIGRRTALIAKQKQRDVTDGR